MRRQAMGILRLCPWFAFSVFPLVGACVTTPVGGGCCYGETPGTATVTAIEVPPSTLYNCPKDPVQVIFDFAPTDASLTSAYAKGRRVTVGSGANPNRAYIMAKGFSVGKVLPCVRQDIRSGSCSPTDYKFPGIDLSDYAPSCFGRTYGGDAGAP